MEKQQDNTLHNYKFEVPEIIFGRGMLSQVGACARRLGRHGREAGHQTDSGQQEAAEGANALGVHLGLRVCGEHFSADASPPAPTAPWP